MHARTIALILCCAALFAVAGCGSSSSGASRADTGLALTVRNPISLENYRAAREYSSAGRYELAREHYLLAYAAAGDDAVLRGILQKELKAVDLMIRTLR